MCVLYLISGQVNIYAFTIKIQQHRLMTKTVWFIIMTENGTFSLQMESTLRVCHFSFCDISFLYFILNHTADFPHSDRTERLWPAKDVQKKNVQLCYSKIGLKFKDILMKITNCLFVMKRHFTNGLHASNKMRDCSLNCHFCAQSTADNTQN